MTWGNINHGERTWIAQYKADTGDIASALRGIANTLDSDPNIALIGLWNEASGNGPQRIQAVFVGPIEEIPNYQAGES